MLNDTRLMMTQCLHTPEMYKKMAGFRNLESNKIKRSNTPALGAVNET